MPVRLYEVWDVVLILDPVMKFLFCAWVAAVLGVFLYGVLALFGVVPT